MSEVAELGSINRQNLANAVLVVAAVFDYTKPTLPNSGESVGRYTFGTIDNAALLGVYFLPADKPLASERLNVVDVGLKVGEATYTSSYYGFDMVRRPDTGSEYSVYDDGRDHSVTISRGEDYAIKLTGERGVRASALVLRIASKKIALSEIAYDERRIQKLQDTLNM